MSNLLTFEQLKQYFYIPTYDAIKLLNCTDNIFKKSCREYGITYWPYRQIKSLSNMISSYYYILNLESIATSEKQIYFKNVFKIITIYINVINTGICYKNFSDNIVKPNHLIFTKFRKYIKCDDYKDFMGIINIDNNDNNNSQNKMSIDFILN